MNILYLSADPAIHPDHQTGYGTHMRQVMAGLSGRGHEVHPLVFGAPATNGRGTAPARAVWKRRWRAVTPRPVWEGLKDLRLIRHDRRVRRDLTAAVRAVRPDVVYERQTYLHRSGVVIAAAAGVPLVIESNAPQSLERRDLCGWTPLGRLGTAWELGSLRAAARVVVVSTAFKEHLAERGVDPDRIRVIPNGVDTARFHPDRADGAAVKRRYGLDRHPVVGFVGSFFPWHGLDRLLSAAAALRRQGSECHLLLVGDGMVRAALEEQAAALGMADRVCFTGSVPAAAVPDYLAAMDVCVMPTSNWYGSPVKVFEYGAMGKPVVGPDTGPVREVLTHAREGLLVDGEAALGQALRRFLSEPGFAAACGERFQRRVRREFTWDRVAERLEACFAEVVAARGAAGGPV